MSIALVPDKDAPARRIFLVSWHTSPSMAVGVPETVFRLLQLVALALPAITIYLQVLSGIHQAKKTIEIDEGIPKVVDSDGFRVPEKEPNVIEALPQLVTDAHNKLSFGLGILSLIFFALATLPLLARFAYPLSVLVSVGIVFIFLAVLSFIFSLVLTLWFSVSDWRKERKNES